MAGGDGADVGNEAGGFATDGGMGGYGVAGGDGFGSPSMMFDVTQTMESYGIDGGFTASMLGRLVDVVAAWGFEQAMTAIGDAARAGAFNNQGAIGMTGDPMGFGAPVDGMGYNGTMSQSSIEGHE